MSNNINSPIYQTNNTIAAKKLNKNSDSRLISSPSSLPKFSISEKLKENDEFRQSVLYDSYIQNKKQQNKKLVPILKYVLAMAFVLFITRSRKK